MFDARTGTLSFAFDGSGGDGTPVALGVLNVRTLGAADIAVVAVQHRRPARR